jgi:hypothetical protein
LEVQIRTVEQFIDLWDIVDGSEEPPPSNADPKVLKKYQRRVKNVMSIIGLNLTDNQLAHIKSCKEVAEAWKTFYNIYETKNLTNIFFYSPQVFHIQDIRKQRYVGPRQQDQDTRGSICLFGRTREIRRYCLDLARELVGIV